MIETMQVQALMALRSHSSSVVASNTLERYCGLGTVPMRSSVCDLSLSPSLEWVNGFIGKVNRFHKDISPLSVSYGEKSSRATLQSHESPSDYRPSLRTDEPNLTANLYEDYFRREAYLKSTRKSLEGRIMPLSLVTGSSYCTEESPNCVSSPRPSRRGHALETSG
jgi:hypothetical protein